MDRERNMQKTQHMSLKLVRAAMPTWARGSSHSCTFGCSSPSRSSLCTESAGPLPPSGSGFRDTTYKQERGQQRGAVSLSNHWNVCAFSCERNDAEIHLHLSLQGHRGVDSLPQAWRSVPNKAECSWIHRPRRVACFGQPGLFRLCPRALSFCPFKLNWNRKIQKVLFYARCVWGVKRAELLVTC